MARYVDISVSLKCIEERQKGVVLGFFFCFVVLVKVVVIGALILEGLL